MVRACVVEEDNGKNEVKENRVSLVRKLVYSFRELLKWAGCVFFLHSQSLSVLGLYVKNIKQDLLLSKFPYNRWFWEDIMYFLYYPSHWSSLQTFLYRTSHYSIIIFTTPVIVFHDVFFFFLQFFLDISVLVLYFYTLKRVDRPCSVNITNIETVSHWTVV